MRNEASKSPKPFFVYAFDPHTHVHPLKYLDAIHLQISLSRTCSSSIKKRSFLIRKKVEFCVLKQVWKLLALKNNSLPM